MLILIRKKCKISHLNDFNFENCWVKYMRLKVIYIYIYISKANNIEKIIAFIIYILKSKKLKTNLVLSEMKFGVVKYILRNFV